MLSEAQNKQSPLHILECAPEHLCAVGERYYRVHYLHFKRMPNRFSKPTHDLYSESYLKDYIDGGGKVVVAVLDSAVVGFVAGRIKRRGADPRKLGHVEMYVDCIYVDIARRSERHEYGDTPAASIALALAEAIHKCATLTECAELVFDVWFANRASLKFCSSLYFLLQSQRNEIAGLDAALDFANRINAMGKPVTSYGDLNLRIHIPLVRNGKYS